MPGPIDADFGATGFSIKTAYYLAHACQAAYLDDLGEAVTLLGLGTNAATFSLGQLHGFVAQLPNATLVAFRGTDSIQTWLTDGRAAQIEDAAYTGKVHQGFAMALAEIWSDLKAKLPLPGSGRPIWVTGHSLGGALATLASVRLQNEGYGVQVVYTYGSPRVGDLDFYAAYLALNYRFVNNNDIVPHLPLETMVLGVPGHGIRFFRYKHVGTLEYLNRFGTLGEGTNDWNAKKMLVLDSLERAKGIPTPDAVKDHFIGNYIDAIAKNL